MMVYAVILFLICIHLLGGTDTDVEENVIVEDQLAPIVDYYVVDDLDEAKPTELTKPPEYPVKVFVMDSTSTYNDEPVLIPQSLPSANFPVTVSQLTNPSVDDYQITIPSIRNATLPPLNLDCENFARYATNCTATATKLYNSTRKAPPMPRKLYQWCSALKHLIQCARDWNFDCKDVTYNHFNEESITGHIYVIEHTCNDSTFISNYEGMGDCLLSVVHRWEACYVKFKRKVDEHRSSSHQWTHYVQHFHLCCARAHFRGCTLNITLEGDSKCTESQAIILQRFSVIVSEGDVHQNCTFNMHYPDCPGGDPRPLSFASRTTVPNTVEMRSNQPNLTVNQRLVFFITLMILLYYFDMKFLQ